jgi:DNA repair exonuclease SbcCD ATPase subunit
MKNCTDFLNSAQQQTRQLKELEWKVTEAERRVHEKGQSLQSKLNENDEELQHMLNNFQETMNMKRKEVQKFEQQVDAIGKDLDNKRNEAKALNMKKGQAVALQEQIQQQKLAQKELINLYIQKYAFLAQFPISSQWNLQIVKDMTKSFTMEFSRLQKESQSDLEKLKLIVTEWEANVNMKRNEMQKLEMELNYKNEEIRNLQQECNQKRIELSRIASSRGTIQRVQQEYETALKTHDEFIESYQIKVEDVKKQIKVSSTSIYLYIYSSILFINYKMNRKQPIEFVIYKKILIEMHNYYKN